MSLTIQPNAPLPGIEHIVVLMLENRSFDNVLGNLYPPSSSFDGIPAGASNTYRTFLGETHTVTPTSTPPSGKSIYIVPNPDPGESQSDMNQQIYNGGSDATMGGFAQNYPDVHRIDGSPGDIMCYFDSNANDGFGQLPVTAFIARNFAVCDQWFGSGPVQTFPNRMFAFCGTPGEFDNTAPINDTDLEQLLERAPGGRIRADQRAVPGVHRVERGAVHHHLVNRAKRTRIGIIIESGRRVNDGMTG